ncbi:hypothetical protein JNM05_12155 [bacterium]|nr:hypothetical protein [bacterium]
MKLKIEHKTLLVVCFYVVGFFSLAAQSRVQEINRDDEKELKVKLEYAAGKISLGKISHDKLCRIAVKETNNEISPNVRYDKDGTTGYLVIDMNENESVGVFDFGNQKLEMEFTDKIPVSFKLEMGACEGKFDFTNIRVKDLTLSMGASSADILFSSKNKDRINKLKIEAGVSKLNMIGLANANFEKMEFAGGVGSYMLDFSGNLSQNSTCNISLGLGRLTIRVPKNLNVKIRTEDSFLASVKISEEYFVKKFGGTYYSINYDDSAPALNLFIETGLGNLKVQAIE